MPLHVQWAPLQTRHLQFQLFAARRLPICSLFSRLPFPFQGVPESRREPARVLRRPDGLAVDAQQFGGLGDVPFIDQQLEELDQRVLVLFSTIPC
ncbi:MAG: hypothetical protein OXS30_13310 [Chloroflexota bacterium]|nr:hypothetical protein [Chloroflexota bacterium]